MRWWVAVVLSLLAGLGVSGCSDDEPDAPASQTAPDGASGNGTVTGQEPAIEELAVGETVEYYLPESDIPLEVTLHDITFERSTNTEGNVYAFMSIEVANVGEDIVDLRYFNWDWVGDDGRLESNPGVFCAGDIEELEYDLGPGQRTVGCDGVDIPNEPGTLTLDGATTSYTLPVDPK